MVILALVMATTGAMIYEDVVGGGQPLDELTEVPLMAAMFAAMVWHARRRLTATEEAERVSMDNARLLERERRFVQDASHELRTPITVALGHAELIQRQAADPTIAEDAAVIADELTRLGRLADRLLLLASSARPRGPHVVPVDVAPLVVEAVHRWTATPRRWELGSVTDATVSCDADRLAVALDAVIENAVQHTRKRTRSRSACSVVGREAVDLDPRHGHRDRRPRTSTGSSIGSPDRSRVGAGTPAASASDSPSSRRSSRATAARCTSRAPKALWTRFEIRLPLVGDPVSPVSDDVVMVEGDARDPVG